MSSFKKFNISDNGVSSFFAKKKFVIPGNKLYENGIKTLSFNRTFIIKEGDTLFGDTLSDFFNTPTSTPTNTPTPTITPSTTPTNTPTPTITLTPTNTPTPTITPTPSPQCILEVQGVLVVETDEPEEPEAAVGVNTVFIHIPNE